jgi:hypothetical protein
MATCLETTVLYAAALARAGLHPVLFVVSGHAFAGYAASDPSAHPASQPESARWSPELRDVFLHEDAVVTGRNELVELVARGLVQPVETTTLTSGNSLPFDQACQTDLKFFNRDSTDLHGMVIVPRAWALGVVPIAARVVADGEVRLITQHIPEAARSLSAEQASPPPPGSDEESNRRALAAFEGPGRVRQWLASLLDLTRRNRLLNLSVKRDGTGSRCVEFSIPLGLLPDVEDRIFSSGQGIELAPPTLLSAQVRDAGFADDAMADDFRRTDRLYWPDPAVLEDTIGAAKKAIVAEAEHREQRIAPAEVDRAAEYQVGTRRGG